MIEILIADDHRIVREGLKQILSEDIGLVVAGEAASGVEVIKKVRERNWDLLILDMSMPGKNGIDLIKQIKQEKPRLPILVLSMHKEKLYGVRSIKAGASGYLTKNSASSKLIIAVKKLAAGGVYISQTIAERMATDFNSAVDMLPHMRLTDRENQIFHLTVLGHSTGEIAADLSLSIKTVSTHKTNILEKMNMSNTVQLVYYAIRHKLVEGENLFPDS